MSPATRQRPRADPTQPAPSLWADTAPAAPHRPALAGEVTADVAVVGAGFSGLSSALHLAEGGADVVVLEAREVGFGASGRNNGQIIPTMSKLDPSDMARRYARADDPDAGERMAALVRDSAALVFDLVRQHGIAAEAEQTGWLQPVHSPGRMRHAERRFEEWAARGADVALLDADEMNARLGSEAFHGGLDMRTGGHVNPLALARGLAQATVLAGVRLFERSPVTHVERQADGWRLTTPEGTVRARTLLGLTHGYTRGVFDEVRRTVVPVASWQAAIAPLSDNVRRAVLPGREAASDTRGDLRFFRPTAQNRIVTGGAITIERDGPEQIARMVQRRLSETFPAIGPVDVTHVWNGYVSMTVDYAPRILTLGPDAYGWAGCNGRGVALCIALGRELARHVLGTPARDLALPFEAPAPIAMHGIAKRTARLMLPRIRWRDAREAQ